MSVSDRTNIICFVAVIILSILCILLAKKNETPLLEVSDWLDSNYGCIGDRSLNKSAKTLVIILW